MTLSSIEIACCCLENVEKFFATLNEEDFKPSQFLLELKENGFDPIDCDWEKTISLEIARRIMSLFTLGRKCPESGAYKFDHISAMVKNNRRQYLTSIIILLEEMEVITSEISEWLLNNRHSINGYVHLEFGIVDKSSFPWKILATSFIEFPSIRSLIVANMGSE